MKQTVSINCNKHETDSFNNRMKQTDIAINVKQTDSINRNKHETDSFN